MFKSGQNVADQLKGLMATPAYGRTPTDRINKTAAMDLLQLFERAGWHAGVFEDSLAVAPELAVKDEKLAFTPGERSIFDVVIALLARYLATLEPFEELLTAKEAAAYLGKAVRTIEHHYYETGDLVGVLRGRDLFFTRAALDAIKSNTRNRKPVKENGQ